MRGRAALALVAALGLGLGLVAGVRLAHRVDPGARAAGAAAAAPPALSPVGGDFSGIARRATPAVVNISATQVYRTERSRSSASSSAATCRSGCPRRSARPAWARA